MHRAGIGNGHQSLFLIIRKPGREGAGAETGDVCHVLAIARTPEEHQVALSILGSIVFKPMRE